MIKYWINYEEWKALRAFYKGKTYIPKINPAIKSLEVITKNTDA